MNVVLLVAEPRAGCSGHVVAGLARVLGCRGHRVQVVCSSSVPSGGASRCWDEVDGGLLPLPDLSKARFDVIVATSWLTLELARMFPHAAGGYWLLEYAPDRLSGRQAEVARHGFDANMVLMAASPALQARVETRHGLTSHVVMPGVPPSVAASGSDEGAGTILLAGGKATDEDVRTLGRMVRDRRPETGVRRLGTPTEADDMPVASPDALTREELAQLCAGAALTIWAGCALEYPLVPFLCAAAGRPTVAVAEGLELSPLRPGESMITAELRRPKQAARAIADLLNDAEARASLGAAARSAVAAMTWEAAAQALEEAFERATDRSRGTRGPEAQPVEASVELGAVDVERGLSVVDSPDSRREPAQIGGTECLRLSRTPRAGPVAYFVLAEEWGRPGLQPYVTVEYFDLGEVEWCLEYDPVRLPGDRRSGFVATPAVRNGNTLAWRRAAFHLPDCLFQRTCNLGDFRVHALNAGDTDLYLRTVALQTTKPPAEVPLLGVPDDQGVARITFGEATQELGVQFVDSPDSLSELGQAGGAPCRIARRTPFAGPVLYLRLDPRFVRPEMEAYITVSYYDAGEGEWCLEYERRGAGPEEEFARTLPVRLRSTGEWRTVTFPVTDAVFRRHCNLGDFRLHASNRSSDTLCIAAVTVNRERPEVPLLGLPDDQGAACITFGEVTQELGVQLVDSPDSRSEPGQVAGVACQVARRSPLAGPVLYFRIDPRFVRPAMEAYITVTYCDTGGGEWFVEYERRGAEPEEEYARTLPVRLRNTGEWRMVTFPVTDAVFRRHCNLGDFRIHAYSPSSEALCIAAVSVGREPPEGAALVGVRPDQKTVSVVLGPVPETTGLWAIESPDSVLQPFADQTGSGVRVLRAPENGPVVYFRLDPRFVREGGSYYVTVDYLDAGAEAWIVEYPAWDRDFEPGQFEGTLSVQQTDSGEWRRVTFCLPNARLARACNLGDFRVHAFEPQAQSITLARVQVSKERPSEPGKFIGIAGDDAVISVALQERSEGAGLEQFDSTDAVSAPAVVAGRQCRRVYNPLSSPQAYFRMDHRFVTPNTPVAITLEFLDVGTNYLGLEYDSTDQSVQRVPENLGAFKPAGAIR
ncbi:MAG: glycosyltransferase family 4 protein, partial [Armatimonadetes bacterium]|nr:glycosyltransferase family 4 protein [Armatimonadota bacterium]